MSSLCKSDIHFWTPWTDPTEDRNGRLYQLRQCNWCRLQQVYDVVVMENSDAVGRNDNREDVDSNSGSEGSTALALRR